MIGSSTRRAVAVAAAGVIATGAAHACAAEAAPGCRGELSASSLQAMPAGAPIVLDVIDQSAANIALGARFTAGMQAGGARMASEGDLHLRLTFLLRNSATNGVYDDFSWLQNPNGADSPLTGNGPRPAITLTAAITDTPNETMLWVASVDCVVETTSMETLAYDLGEVVGRAVGKNEPLVNF